MASEEEDVEKIFNILLSHQDDFQDSNGYFSISFQDLKKIAAEIRQAIVGK